MYFFEIDRCYSCGKTTTAVRPYGDSGPTFCCKEHLDQSISGQLVRCDLASLFPISSSQKPNVNYSSAREKLKTHYDAACEAAADKYLYSRQTNQVFLRVKAEADAVKNLVEPHLQSIRQQALDSFLIEYRAQREGHQQREKDRKRESEEFTERQRLVKLENQRKETELKQREQERKAAREAIPETTFLDVDDPKHPHNLCYQCHRPLPRNLHLLPWNDCSDPGDAMFDTERCKDTAVRRHVLEADKDTKWGLQKARATLNLEYARFVKQYEDEALAAMPPNPPAIPIPGAYRHEHTHILGPSGSGKTTLIQQLVLDDLAKDDPPGMVIIDPKGLMVERLQSLDVFNPDNGRLRDRLVIVDPTHDPPPALNMFHAASKWNSMWSDDQRRRIENQAIGTFAFIFSSTGSKLTDKQTTPFSYAVRLMFNMESTIHTLVDLMDDPTRTDDKHGPALSQSRFAPFIGRLDEMSRRFFEREFFSSNYRETRQQIKARIYGVLQHPEFLRMFEARERKLDMLDCLQNRSIVLVNTSMNVMGSDASQLLGRYIVALTLNAAFARFTIPKNEWHQAHLIIDEFQEFADDEKTPELLRLAREYNLAVTLAHQEMHGSGMTDKIRSAVSTNTTIKYASRPEGVDISYVARDMRCEASFLTQQTKTRTEARFACFVRGMLEHPMAITIPFGNIGHEPQMSKTALQRLLAINSERLSARPSSMARDPAAASVHPDPPPDAGDPASEW